MNANTGILLLNSYVSNNMKGYLMFNIECTDLAGHKGIAAVKIYIVSEKNRVKFLFLSAIEAIREKETFVSIVYHIK